MNARTSRSDYPMTTKERANLARLVDYSSVESIPGIWSIASQKFGNAIALLDPHAKPEVKLTYSELYQQIQQFAAGLQALGIQQESRMALFADNSPRWLIADQGMMMSGAVNIVRSAQADKDELLFILGDSGCTALAVENLATLQKLQTGLDALPIEFIVLIADETPPEGETRKVLNFSQVMELGKDRKLQPVNQTRLTLATLLYTSGTTGKPKGVMLTHGNLMHQVDNLGVVVQPQMGDRVVTILPTWHAYERSGEYFLLSQGCTQIYTNLRHVKSDFKQYKPTFTIGVPRLWESIYEGIQKQFREQPPKRQQLIQRFLGLSQRYIEAKRTVQGLNLQNLNPTLAERLTAASQVAALYPVHAIAEQVVYKKVRQALGGEIKQVISGGGSLAMHLDTFFEIIGVTVLVGYGLTETSPVTHARRPWHNLRGSAGRPIPGTQTKIVEPETRKALPPGQRGLVLIKGPQVMQGYYRNPQATTKAIDAEGWFDTGDLGWVTPKNDLVLTGRAKDTIVLTNGENIEPQPIEDACVRSAYIDQIMLVGQDQRSLGALIVPNLEALEQWATQINQPVPIDLESKPVQDLIRQELNREVKNRPGYRADDRIGPFRLIQEPFTIENGMMTQTLKIKRPVVSDRYRDTIDRMFE